MPTRKEMVNTFGANGDLLSTEEVEVEYYEDPRDVRISELESRLQKVVEGASLIDPNLATNLAGARTQLDNVKKALIAASK